MVLALRAGVPPPSSVIFPGPHSGKKNLHPWPGSENSPDSGLYLQPSPDETRPLEHESTIFPIPAVLQDVDNKFLNRDPSSEYKPVKII